LVNVGATNPAQKRFVVWAFNQENNRGWDQFNDMSKTEQKERIANPEQREGESVVLMMLLDQFNGGGANNENRPFLAEFNPGRKNEYHAHTSRKHRKDEERKGEREERPERSSKADRKAQKEQRKNGRKNGKNSGKGKGK